MRRSCSIVVQVLGGDGLSVLLFHLRGQVLLAHPRSPSRFGNDRANCFHRLHLLVYPLISGHRYHERSNHGDGELRAAAECGVWADVAHGRQFVDVCIQYRNHDGDERDDSVY